LNYIQEKCILYYMLGMIKWARHSPNLNGTSRRQWGRHSFSSKHASCAL
jgi:hypothetical protein